MWAEYELCEQCLLIDEVEHGTILEAQCPIVTVAFEFALGSFNQTRAVPRQYDSTPRLQPTTDWTLLAVLIPLPGTFRRKACGPYQATVSGLDGP